MSSSGGDAPPAVHSSSQVPDASPPTDNSGAGGGGKRKTYKVIVIGDSGVGKTCLTFRFCAGHFPGSTEATIGVDFREKLVHVDNEDIRLQLWDTAGQERFRRSMVSHYYRNVSAAVLVYDVTRRASFDALSNWVRECQSHGLVGAVPMIVVGNKYEDGLRPAVSTAQAQRFADDHGMPLFETSAKDDARADHVDAIFMTLAHKIKQNKPLLSPASNGPDAPSSSSSSSPTVRPGRRIVYKNDGYEAAEGGGGGGCCS